MCSVICRVGFEFISLGIQLEHISSKPKMSSARLCKVKLPNFPSCTREGVGEAAATRSWAKWDGDGMELGWDGDRAQQLSAPGCPASICSIHSVFCLQTLLSTPPGGICGLGRSRFSQSSDLVGICVQGWQLDRKFVKGEGAPRVGASVTGKENRIWGWQKPFRSSG